MRVLCGISDGVLIAIPSSSSSSSSSTVNLCFRSPQFNLFSHSKFPFVSSFNQCSSFFYIGKLEAGLEKNKTRKIFVRASDQSKGNLAPIAPVHLESSAGQMLTHILQTNPHLFPAAIDQQLENLQNDTDAQKEETSSSSQGDLYRRIAKVREKERRKTLEEIIYCSIVHKFVEKNISMILATSLVQDLFGRVDLLNQEQELISVHSPEALEMIQSHLSLVLGERLVGPLQSLVDIGKVKLGKLYAASIMYGYFLRRVDRRYQLEKAMKTLPKDFGKNTASLRDALPQSPFWDPDSLIQIPADGDITDFEPVDGGESESYKLRSYVMYLDTETLQRYATIRSKEAMSLIERQTQALFGRPDITITNEGALEMQNDEVISITFSGLAMLVLEAVAFGSFLWDSEDYAESNYSFVNS